MLPLVVHQKYTGGEELGCSRWSFTRTYTGGEELGCSRWSFTRIGRQLHKLCPLHKLRKRSTD